MRCDVREGELEWKRSVWESSELTTELSPEFGMRHVSSCRPAHLVTVTLIGTQCSLQCVSKH